jgi:hypothetical protein
MKKVAKKKSETPGKPVVSKIPMAVSDSALVIDLPDGQKLVVGKMTHGTVIEVATWRGTGRPDSRTSRMMLGMTNAELEATIADEAKAEVVQNKSLKDGFKDPRIIIGIVIRTITKSLKWLFDFKDQAGTKDRKGKQEIAEVNQAQSHDGEVSKTSGISKFKGRLKRETSDKPLKRTSETAIEQDGSSEVDKWLDELTSSPEKEPNSTKDVRTKKTIAKKTVVKSTKSKRVR